MLTIFCLLNGWRTRVILGRSCKMLGGALALVVAHVAALEGTDDEPQCLVRAEIAERPVYQGYHFIAEAHQRHQVDEQPSEPAKNTVEMNALRQVYHGLVPAHDGHHAFVEVLKGLGRFAFDDAHKVRGHERGLLLGNRSQHGQTFGHLRTTVVAGGIPTRALLEGAAVYLCSDIRCRYGTSELGVLAEAAASKVLEQPGLIGFVLPGFEMAAFRENGACCAPGEMGIVKARVKPGPDSGEDPWTDHGDVGWITKDGEVFVVGRTSDIDPAEFASYAAREVAPVYEIEHLLRLEWDSADAAALVVESAKANEAPEIWVATVDCKDASADQLEQILRRRGIVGNVRLLPVPAIPRGAAGKIQRMQLKSMMSESVGSARG